MTTCSPWSTPMVSDAQRVEYVSEFNCYCWRSLYNITWEYSYDVWGHIIRHTTSGTTSMVNYNYETISGIGVDSSSQYVVFLFLRYGVCCVKKLLFETYPPVGTFPRGWYVSLVCHVSRAPRFGMKRWDLPEFCESQINLIIWEFKIPKKFDFLEKMYFFSEIFHISIKTVTLSSSIHILGPTSM